MSFLKPKAPPPPPAPIYLPPPALDDPKTAEEIERERRRQLVLRGNTAGQQATRLTGSTGILAPILGNAAQLGGV